MNKNLENIADKAKFLYKTHKTRDPFEIASEIGVEIIYSGELNRLKGLYRVIKRNRFIILNNKNTRRINTIVCAHELGHDQLHRAFAKDNSLKEFMLYDMSLKQEYEANLFAAELLLDDEEILACIRLGYDIFQTAGAMNSDINLVALKIDILNRKGYNFNTQHASTSFLKPD